MTIDLRIDIHKTFGFNLSLSVKGVGCSESIKIFEHLLCNSGIGDFDCYYGQDWCCGIEERYEIKHEDDCNLFCSGQDAGLNGACCNDYYCDCETNSPHSCPDDQVYCDKLGGCTDLFGQDCNGLDFCCNPKPPNVCEAICEESGIVITTQSINFLTLMVGS